MQFVKTLAVIAPFAPLLALAGVYNATVYEEDACTGESISFAGGDDGGFSCKEAIDGASIDVTSLGAGCTIFTYSDENCMNSVNEGSITGPINGPPAVCQDNAETGDFDSWNVTCSN